jgi:hypothetical protein
MKPSLRNDVWCKVLKSVSQSVIHKMPADPGELVEVLHGDLARYAKLLEDPGAARYVVAAERLVIRESMDAVTCRLREVAPDTQFAGGFWKWTALIADEPGIAAALRRFAADREMPVELVRVLFYNRVVDVCRRVGPPKAGRSVVAVHLFGCDLAYVMLDQTSYCWCCCGWWETDVRAIHSNGLLDAMQPSAEPSNA